MRTDLSGRGVISLLDGTRLMMSPRIYATFLLWLLSELFEQLDEVGDPDKPRLVFFFDEAHLLFTTAPKALLQRIEQVVRLIRSKGVGVYFVTQSPADIPDSVLAQLGNRVQHALRAYTPREQKAVRVAAESFRANPALEQDTATMISELGMGEALVSVLDSQAQPSPVERTLICPPRSQIGPVSEAERNACIQRSPLTGIYDTAMDRESAFELLRRRADSMAATEQEAGADIPTKPAAGSRRQSAAEAFFKSMLRSIGSQLGRQIIRGVLGSITAKR
jgi:DNA helicase HerA-like ATPase